MKWAHGVGSRPRHTKIIVLPQFRTSDQHEVEKGLPVQLRNLHFTTVLGVRRSLFALRVAWATWKKGRSATWKICISPQFWASDEHEVTRGLSPAVTHQTYPAEKKRRILKRSSIFEEQRSQQLFSADFLSSLSQQLFSAALLSSFSQQLFSAALLSSLSQQLFSAALLSSLSQQLFSAALLSYHLAVVRGWWSASNIIFSSSSQLSSCCGQGLVVS